MLHYAESVEIVDVSPRDGLQSLERTVPLEDKLALVALLVNAGFRTIEVTSFVRPDVVPQLGDAAELMAALPRAGVHYRALVPNRRGAERALAAGVDGLVGLVTTSDSYNRRNSRMTVAQNLDVLADVAALAAEADIPLTVAIGLGWFCPYEGDVPLARVLAIVDRLRGLGVRSLYLATSVGMDGPREVGERCAALLDRHPDLSLGIHLHDTNGLALANALAAMDAGVRWFEGSICGIGGGIRMPPDSPPIGNVASEDLVAMFEDAGVATGIELEGVRTVALDAARLLGVEPRSRLLAAGRKGDFQRRAQAA